MNASDDGQAAEVEPGWVVDVEDGSEADVADEDAGEEVEFSEVGGGGNGAAAACFTGVGEEGAVRDFVAPLPKLDATTSLHSVASSQGQLVESSGRAYLQSG